MRAVKLGSLVILALIASCGAAEDGSLDTEDVAPGTRAAAASANATAGAEERHAEPADVAPPAGADEAMPTAATAPKLAGFVGARFVVFDTDDRTVVFDAETEHAFGVFGHPVTATNDDFDVWREARFAPTRSATRVLASDDGAAMLLRTEAGIQAVDLRRRGAFRTGWRGEASGAALAPDGSLFAAWTSDRLDLVRVADGARASYAVALTDRAAPDVQWTADGAYWIDADGLRFVETSSFREHRVTMPNAQVATSKDGAVFVVWRSGSRAEPGVIEVRRAGPSGRLERRARLASAFVAQVVIDDDGSRVAWSEQANAYDEPNEQPALLHTLDVESGAHARFRAQARHCSIGPEWIVGFEGGTLKTDAECSPGCPSIASQAELIAYDVSSGKKLREWLGERRPPFNEELGEHVAKGEELARRFGVVAPEGESLPFAHHPSAPTLVVATATTLRVATERDGRVLAELDRSSGFRAAGVRFTPDGARIVGVGEGGRLAIWDAADGRSVWSWN